jgi:hypothetical protein
MPDGADSDSGMPAEQKLVPALPRRKPGSTPGVQSGRPERKVIDPAVLGKVLDGLRRLPP